MPSRSDRGHRNGGSDPPANDERHRPALRVDGLRKVYGDDDDAVVAVDGISFDIEAGSVVGILGPNGAGKTTLIKSILSIVIPTEGTVEINGIDIHRDTSTAYQNMGALFEGARNMYWRLTPLENLRFFSSIAGYDPNELRGRHEQLLEQFDMMEKKDTPVRELSRGQKQKVSIACTLAGDSEFIFLDEPTLGLDVESSIELRSELRRLADDDGTTIMLSSHNLDVIEAVCDRVIIINDGELIADDSVENLLGLFNQQLYEVDIEEPLGSYLRAELRSEFQFEPVDGPQETVRFRVQVTGDELYDFMALLGRNDVSIESINAVEADLEDVFLKITERSDGASETRESHTVGVTAGE